MTDEAPAKAARSRRRVRPIEAATRRDLKTVGDLTGSGREMLAAMAMALATAIDSFSVNISTAAQLSAVTKAHADLRATMKTLREGGGGDGDGDPAGAGLPAPVWDGAQPGAADAGRAGGGDRGAAG